MDGTTKHEYKVLTWVKKNGKIQRPLTASDRERTKEKREMIKTPYKIKNKSVYRREKCSVETKRGDFNNEQRKIIHSKL